MLIIVVEVSAVAEQHECVRRPLLHGSWTLPALRQRPFRLLTTHLCRTAEWVPLCAAHARPNDAPHGAPQPTHGAPCASRPLHGRVHGACAQPLEPCAQNGDVGAQGVINHDLC